MSLQYAATDFVDRIRFRLGGSARLVRPGQGKYLKYVRAANRARDQKEWLKAVQLYAAAVAVDPSREEIFVQIGHALKELGDYAGAEMAYSRFIRSHPNDADIHLQFGHLYNKQGDVERALSWYERAALLAPANDDIKHHLRLARARVGRRQVEHKRSAALDLIEQRKWPEAKALLQELVMSDGERSLVGLLANVTKECGDFVAARDLYLEYRRYAEESEPDLRADVELQMGHLYQTVGDLEQSLRHYARARRLEFEQLGYVPSDSVSDREVRNCINEIYTCFWDGR